MKVTATQHKHSTQPNPPAPKAPAAKDKIKAPPTNTKIKPSTATNAKPAPNGKSTPPTTKSKPSGDTKPAYNPTPANDNAKPTKDKGKPPVAPPTKTHPLKELDLNEYMDLDPELRTYKPFVKNWKRGKTHLKFQTIPASLVLGYRVLLRRLLWCGVPWGSDILLTCLCVFARSASGV
jgi:hypothetical protein